MMMTDGAQTASTIVVDDPAPPVPQGAQPPAKVVIPGGLLPKTPVPSWQDQLAANKLVGPVCPSGACPSSGYITVVQPNACDAVITGQPLAGLYTVVGVGAGVIKTIIGRERRMERRANRRG